MLDAGTAAPSPLLIVTCRPEPDAAFAKSAAGRACRPTGDWTTTRRSAMGCAPHQLPARVARAGPVLLRIRVAAHTRHCAHASLRIRVTAHTRHWHTCEWA